MGVWKNSGAMLMAGALVSAGGVAQAVTVDVAGNFARVQVDFSSPDPTNIEVTSSSLIVNGTSYPWSGPQVLYLDGGNLASRTWNFTTTGISAFALDVYVRNFRRDNYTLNVNSDVSVYLASEDLSLDASNQYERLGTLNVESNLIGDEIRINGQTGIVRRDSFATKTGGV